MIKLTDKNGHSNDYFEARRYPGYEKSTARKRRQSEDQETKLAHKMSSIKSSPYKAVFDQGIESFSDAIKIMNESPKSETIPKRYKKEACDDEVVSISDSPGPSSAFKRNSANQFQQQDNAQFLRGAPREFIDAEDAYKIKTQTEFPNTRFGK